MLTEGQIKKLIERHENFISTQKDYINGGVDHPYEHLGIVYSEIIIETLKNVLGEDSFLPENKSVKLKEVNEVEELFIKCASKMVSEEYKDGYLEALNHVKEKCQ